MISTSIPQSDRIEPLAAPLEAKPQINLDTIILPVTDSTGTAALPPVRIFLGTESAQWRAERVFVWSVCQHRNPARQYEITLMKNILGFHPKGWTTGFTNYRFAIPELAGMRGRAIYNDVDQIYLADPAVLFDADMKDSACLTLSEHDTSVMLLDCARMSQIWTLDNARALHKKKLLAKLAMRKDLIGVLPGKWNARDDEYEQGHSALLHYTTLHTQPWTPHPERFAYQVHAQAKLWTDMERQADACGFTLFDRLKPSVRYQQLIAAYENLHSQGSAKQGLAAEKTFSGKVLPKHIPMVARLVELSESKTLLDYGAGKAGGYDNLPGAAPDCAIKGLSQWGEDVRITLYDPGFEPYAHLPNGPFDGVVCTDVLEHIAEEDIAWVLHEIFSRASAFVYATVACYPAKKKLPNGENAHVCQKSPAWWGAQLRSAAAHYPQIHWELSIREKNWHGRKVSSVKVGGKPLAPPKVWVLADDRLGNANQAIALAKALGFPYECKPMAFNLMSRLHNRLLGRSRIGLQPTANRQLHPPWPDIVIAAGRRTAPVSRWIGKQTKGRTRLVQLGRKGGDRAAAFDAVITPVHCYMAFNPKRIETTLPLSPMETLTLVNSTNTQTEAPTFASAKILVLLGGPTRRHKFDLPQAKSLSIALLNLQQKYAARLIVAGSPRTAPQVLNELRRILPTEASVLNDKEARSRYWSMLASADAVVVTSDSESMLADAIASGHPVYIHELPVKPLSRWLSMGQWVLTRAQHHPKNKRATTRPQQGLEYLCARAIDIGLIRPPRDLNCLHRELYQQGLARPLCNSRPHPFSKTATCVHAESQKVAEQVLELLDLRA